MGRSGSVQHIDPAEVHRHPAFTNAVAVTGPVTTIYIGGQNALTPEGEIVGDGDLEAQTIQALRNLEAVLAAAGAGLEDVVKWTIHVVADQPVERGFAAFQRVWDPEARPPAITVTVVEGLANPAFLVEIDAIAVIAAPPPG
jgi:enamine deaminase RidA (YjgF/YER057c/UK114 family)